MNHYVSLAAGERFLTSPSSRAFSESDAQLTRVVDIAAALALLAFLAPLMILIALLVYVSDPGPVIFAHRRVGRGGKMFPVYKFRSMVVDAESRLAELLARDPEARAQWNRDHKLKNDPRITAFGNFLRRSSLDELPQLINVIRGDMSLVGPRPISPAESERYGRYIREYWAVRPGITGLWQISGRNDVSYRRRVALDVAFARSYSLALYLRIAVMTVPAVIFARGSY